MENKVTVSQIGLKYGLIIGLVFIVYGMILQFLNLDMKLMQNLGYVNYVVLAAVIFLGHKAFKEGGDGFMSLGQGIGMGTLISLVGSALSGVFTYIYFSFIDDSMITKIKDAQIAGMEEAGMQDAQIEQAMKMAENFMTPLMMSLMSIVIMVIFGFIISLIVSLFTKKANPTLEV